MEEEKPNLAAIQGERSDMPKIKPTTGLPEGQVGSILESGFTAAVRRAWGKFRAKSKPPKDGWGEGF